MAERAVVALSADDVVWMHRLGWAEFVRGRSAAQRTRDGVGVPPEVLRSFMLVDQLAREEIGRRDDVRCGARGHGSDQGIGHSDIDPGGDRVSLPWMTTAEASAALGCTDRHVVRLASSGDLIGRRVGGVWEIDPDSVNDRQRRRTKGQ